MKQKIEIEVPEGKKAVWVNGVLTLVDETPEKPQDVKERIKTFEDACNELGIEHPFVVQFNEIHANFLDKSNASDSADIIAYLKLRIIVAALNEGWEPQFTEDEYRWYSWYELLTQEQIDDMDEEDKCRVVGRSNHSADAYGGVACASAGYAFSSSYSDSGPRLAFKTRELALYAGQQFIDIYVDFNLKDWRK